MRFTLWRFTVSKITIKGLIYSYIVYKVSLKWGSGNITNNLNVSFPVYYLLIHNSESYNKGL